MSDHKIEENLLKRDEVEALLNRYLTEGPAVFEPFIAEESRIISHGPNVAPFTFSGEWRGLDGFREYMDNIWSNLELVDVKVDRVLHADDTLIALTHQTWRQHLSGKTFTTPKAEISRFNGGKLVEFQEFWDPASALMALKAD